MPEKRFNIKMNEKKLEVYFGLAAMFVAYAVKDMNAVMFIGLLVIILSMYHIEQILEAKKR
ncbi:MAG: hypothetical protein ABH829_05020 [archaeon]